MHWGMENRMARIIKPEDGRCVMLAVDHGYFLGPTSGLEQPRETIEPLLPHADAIMLTRGVLRNAVDAKMQAPVVLRVSGGTSILKELSNEDITVSIEDAIRLNVSAMALSIFVGSEFEKETLVSLAKLVDEGERYGIPVLAVTAVGKDMARDERYLGLVLPHRRRAWRPHRQDLLLRELRERGQQLPDSGHRGRRQEDPGDGSPGARPQCRGPWRRGRRHGQEHLPVRQPRGDDPGGQGHRSRRRLHRGSLPDLRVVETGGGTGGRLDRPGGLYRTNR